MRNHQDDPCDCDKCGLTDDNPDGHTIQDCDENACTCCGSWGDYEHKD
jgi:hypothetical protein